MNLIIVFSESSLLVRSSSLSYKFCFGFIEICSKNCMKGPESKIHLTIYIHDCVYGPLHLENPKFEILILCVLTITSKILTSIQGNHTNRYLFLLLPSMNSLI